MQPHRTIVAWSALSATLWGLAGCVAEPASHPCDGVWGTAPASGRLHVDAAAAPGGDGSLGAPLTELWTPGGAADSALERLAGEGSIAVASGSYDAGFLLDAAHAGLELTGCGADETTLLGVVEVLPNGDPGDLLPVAQVTGAGADDVLIRDLTLSAGRRNLVIHGGAGAGGAVVVQDVMVDTASRAGVVVDGVATVAELVGVTVTAVTPEDDIGWGIAVQTGLPAGSSAAAPTVLTDVTVSDATGVGVLVDAGFIEVAGLSVTNTLDVDGALGRGVQVQGFSSGCLEDVVSSGNTDAALFLSAPGRDGAALEVVGGTFTGTLAGALPNTAETSGDGIVVTDAGGGFGAGAYLATFEDTVASAVPRAGLLAEAVTIQVGPNNVFGKGTVLPFATQGDAVVEGIGGGPPPLTPEVLEDPGGTDPVELIRDEFAADDINQ